jgi:hypothetical protein
MKKELFGQIALRAGFINERDLSTALRQQKQIVAQGGKHRLIGLLMVEMGLLGTDQFISLLKELQLDATLHSQPLKPASFGD